MYAVYRFREDQELVCDGMAIRYLKGNQVIAYGQTILTLLEQYTKRQYVLGSVNLSASKQQLKRRIMMIKLFKRKSIVWSVIGIAIVILFSGCALIDGKSDTEKDKVSSKQTGTQQNSSNTESQNKNEKQDHTQVNNHTLKNTNTKESNKTTTPVKHTTNMHTKLIRKIYQLSKEGKVLGSDFVSGKDLIDKVHQSWGEPDKPIGASDPYEVYNLGAGRGTFAFGIGRGEVIYDIRSFGSGVDPSVDYNLISFMDIKQTLGNPSEIRKNNKDDILVYKVGEYELKFVGPHDKQMLHHISVYSPKAAAPMGER